MALKGDGTGMKNTETVLPFEFGAPPMPKGMERGTRKSWGRVTAELLAARKLAQSDAELVMALVQARAEAFRGAGERKAAARKEVERLEAIWIKRPAFPEPHAQPVAAPATAVKSLEAFIQDVRCARDSFSSRLVPGETVCLDNGGPCAWLPDSAAGIARQYAMDVTQGAVPAGQLVKLACARFLKELEVGHTRGFYFDPVEAELIKNWFDFYVTEWEVQPWQVFIVVNLFAFKWASGLRRFKWSWLATGRKNGKSSFLASIGTFCLCADLCVRPEIYSAATKRDQAKIIWGDAKQLVRSSPQLKDAVKVMAHSIEIDDTGATFEALGADAHTMDGLRPQCCLVDEIHEHPSDAVTKRLQSGTLSRPQPIMFSATTAGEDRDSWCYSQHELYERMLRGTTEDYKFSDERFVYIAMCDEGDNPADEAVWYKANPNLGVSVNIDGLRSQAAEFATDPQALFSFQRFHLNIWNSVIAGHSLPQDKINAAVGCAMPAGGPMELRKWFLGKAKASEIKFCGGFDLGLSDDLAAFVLVSDKFGTCLTSTGARADKTVMVPWFWIPEKNIREHELSWRVPLQLWIREGWIKVAGEELVDLDKVEADIKTICATHRVPVIGYDKWKSETMMARLHGEHVSHCVAVPQLPSFLTTPCRSLKSGVLNGTYAHLGNPVMKWMLSNVDLEPNDKTGGIKPAKSGADRRNKIDGVQGAVTAIQQLQDVENKKYFGAAARIYNI
jgi:phage terminase large subunit-like protein